MKTKEEGRNCNLQIKLITNADIFGESFVLPIHATPLVGHITEDIDVLTIGLGHDEKEALMTFDIARRIMYAVQANPNIKFTEIEKKETTT